MNTIPINQGLLSENCVEIGPVNRAMVRARAVELALINGRATQEVSKADWEQAKLELTGESDADQQETLQAAIPETQGWDPVPGSTGRQVPETACDDEDDEGRSSSEQRVDEGVAEAEHDQTLQAARAAVTQEARASPVGRDGGAETQPGTRTPLWKQPAWTSLFEQ